MHSVERAKQILEQSAITLDKIKETRAELEVKRDDYKVKLETLTDDLGRALAERLIHPELTSESKINQIRKSLRDKERFLEDAELILSSLNAIEIEQKQLRLDPQRIIRTDAEDRRQKELNLNLQKKLLQMAGESEIFMHKDDFLRVAEKFKRNARSLNQEAMADDFLRSLRN